MREYQNSKSKIIAATISILAEKGPGHLPVEDIASRADISKGGFFYNFKTKEELLIATMDTLKIELDAQVEARSSADPNPHGRFLRSILSTFLENEINGDTRLRAVLAGFVEIFTSFPALKATYQPVYEYYREQLLNDGMSPDDVLLITSALDGVLLTFILGSDSQVTEERMKLVRHMIKLTNGPSS